MQSIALIQQNDEIGSELEPNSGGWKIYGTIAPNVIENKGN